MKEKILAALKTKYKNMGLSDEILEGVANQLEPSVTTEEAITTAVAGVEPQLKAIQTYADKRVNKLKSENEDLREQINKGGDKSNQQNQQQQQSQDEIPAWAKAISEGLTSLTQKFTALDGEKTHAGLFDTLVKTLDDKKVPKSFYRHSLTGRKFEKQEDIDTLASSISSDYDAFVQESANSEEGAPPPAGSGNAPKDAKSIAEMINKGTKEITESKN